MHFDILPPRDILVHFMNRIYGRGMTTTSGGNLSLKDTQGDLWVTPGGVDKGSLRPEDIVRVDPSGTAHGIHKPSVELPFHAAIYDVRPDVRGIVHAHSSALVTFSLIGEAPDTRVFPRAAEICGEVGLAPYALPGSEQLGRNVAGAFAAGHNAVLLENHGITTVGADLAEAFRRFETLDFCARLLIHASRVGTPQPLEESVLSTARQPHAAGSYWTDYSPTTAEKELRATMAALVRRAYAQSLFTSTEGTFAARLEDGRFVVTPYGLDRYYLEPEDLVAVRDGRPQPHTTPSRAWKLIGEIFEKNPSLQAVIIAHPPYTMAFAVTGARFHTPVIPESYMLLRDIPVLPFNAQIDDQPLVATTLSETSPVVLMRNECVFVAGASLLQAFDRLEVTEFTAKSLIAAAGVGTPKELSEAQKAEIRNRFFG
ncbi:MAG: class II aldolase/adducin family protein [Chitinivibrionales bacterium]|nr:class II aldolase/adducin family protein [Chitinivibrionales bacterium]